MPKINVVDPCISGECREIEEARTGADCRSEGLEAARNDAEIALTYPPTTEKTQSEFGRSRLRLVLRDDRRVTK
jgi:hypothetical protein